ncbi:MAG TPA: hypothetical protein VNG93_12190 [Candidatus Dormibacteraeota bacterium]|nr:hypothetical protein [Candidatus Dormibacteraeota bacterium]
MERGLWALAGLVLGLGGWYLLLLGFAGGWLGYLVIGVGVGIGCAVLGSLAHDALAGPSERF